MILYLCPAISYQSAGARVLYRQVQVLVQNGFPAAVMYPQRGFDNPDAPQVPIRYFTDGVSPDDIAVIPEGWVPVMQSFQSLVRRRFVISLSWDYIFNDLPDGVDWRTLGIERVLTNSQHIADFVQWTMRLPTHVFTWGIKPELYFYEPAAKRSQIVYIKRKRETVQRLLRALWSR